MDKRFLYVVIVIIGILVIILAWQDSQKQAPSVLDKLNATPSPVFGNGSQTITPMAQQQLTNPDGNKNSGNQNSSSQSAAQTLEGGVQIQDAVLGNGSEAKSGDTIAVNYTGYLENGQKFDSSYDRNKPFIFQLGAGQVIQGWDIGVAGMKEGGKRRIFIPSNLAYGEQGAGNGAIPPNANLVFDVELLSIQGN